MSENEKFTYLSQKLAIIVLLTVSIFLIIFNIILVLPYVNKDLTPRFLKGLDRIPAPKPYQGAELTLNETQIRRLMHERELHQKNVINETEVILEYSQKKFYPISLNPWKLCQKYDGSKESVFLLLVVKSSTAQFARRQAIRQTWGDTHKFHLNTDQTGHFNKGIKLFSTDKNSKPLVIKRLFLLAKGTQEGQEELLKLEAEEYGDILQGDFQDSFRNLTLKDIMFLNWQRKYCSQAQFVFKGDDDVFVNIFNIMRYIESHKNITIQRELFTGSVLWPSPRITNPKSKYYVSSNLWPDKYYPPYVSGGGFIMSTFVAAQLLEAMKKLAIIPIDDAFVGVCLKKLGIQPTNHKGFKSWGISRGDKDVCVFRDVMTLHKLSPEEMKRSWDLLLQSFEKPPGFCTETQYHHI